MSNRRGSISMLSLPPHQVQQPINEDEVKGIKSIKKDLSDIHAQLNKLSQVSQQKPCRCKCNEVEQRVQQQIIHLNTALNEIINN